MARIVKNGVTYSRDPATLVAGSSTLTQNNGILETKAGYVRGDASSGGISDGVFRIFSGTEDPSSGLGQNGDIYLKRVG